MRFVGHVSLDDVLAVRASIERLWHDDPSSDAHLFLVVFADEEHALGPDVRAALVGLMKAAVIAGVELVVGVSASPVSRMVGAAIALAAGLPSHALDADEDIPAVLREALERRAGRGRRLRR